MSRGPLEVLRDMRADAVCTTHRDVCDECKAYDEAIAQVEALVEAMRDIESMRPGTPTMDMRAKVGDPKAIAYRYQRVAREALAPFTPGQDSEGGGNG